MQFDRYTILKFKEKFHHFSGGFRGYVTSLYAMCNATRITRFITLVCIVVILFLVGGIVGLLKPEPPIPLHKKLVLTKTDTQGDTWTMDYLKDQDLQAILNGPVKPGEPLTLTVVFRRDRQELLMKPEITGAAGEQYFPGILKNGQWQPPPGFVLTDQNDRLLAKGQFEYG